MRLRIEIDNGANVVVIEKEVEIDFVEIRDAGGATVIDTAEHALLDHLLSMADAAALVHSARRARSS